MAWSPAQMRNRSSAGGGSEDGTRALSHVSSTRVLLGVWAALVVLTGITVAATHVDLGSMNLWLALAIATLKASLVALYFMHLRYDRPVNLIIFLSTLLFVCLFVGLALIDTRSYQPDLIPGYAQAMPR
jgi:cytochrome c oxidase subunit IV